MKLTIAEGFVLCLCLQVQGYVGQTFRFGCSNYTFHDASGTVKYRWKESKTLCENGSKLVSLENLPADRRELNFLNKITKTSTKFQYYIGLRKDNAGNWTWISNNSTMEASNGDYPWNKGEPSGNGDCVKIWFKESEKKYVFDDIDCNELKQIGYICERLVECDDKNGHTTTLSTSQVLAVTSATIRTTLATQQQSTEAESTVSTEGPKTKLPTTQALPVTSAAIQSTLLTHQQQSTKGESTVSRETTLTEDTFDESPDVKTTKESSFLIVIILSLLAVTILTILILFFVFFVRRRRSNKEKVSLLREQSSDRDHYLHSSTELTVHFSMSRPEEGLSSLKTVSESKDEYTYAVVDNSKRKSRCTESSNYEQGDVHIQQGNAAARKDPTLQEENVDATYATTSSREGGSHAELLNSSSMEHGKETTQNSEAADGQNECGEYLYAAVDKARKKQRPPQMPSPYRGLVYADMSHLPENNTGNINRANAPTVYAVISHQKTGGANSRLPKESDDQETTYNNNEL